MKTLVLCNQKGGVGKSAVATLLSHHLAHRGQRVLAIDLDHQGNFTKPLRLSGRAAPAAFAADAPARETVSINVSSSDLNLATPEGVASATTRSVVVSSLSVLGLDFILTAMMFSI